MIVTRSPLRVSFFGGSSDLPQFYNVKEGLCVSTTINSFIYLAVHPCVANHLKIIYSELELVNNVEDIKHDRVRECLKLFEMTSNMEICSFSNVPVKGTGLGSSSAFTVGLIKALYHLKYGPPVAKGRDLADLACFVEINRCGETIGRQDQYAAACGGFKSYRFTPDYTYVQPVSMDPNTKYELEDHLLFFNTGIQRKASSILRKDFGRENFEIISTFVDMAQQSLKFLEEDRIMDFGDLLHQSWCLKRTMGGSNDHIDEMYDIAMKAGGMGGKLLGAGGGGYLMIFVPPKDRGAVIRAMSNHMYERRDFRFHNEGSTICNLDWK